MMKARVIPDRAWALAIILIAFGMRVYGLGDLSLWFERPVKPDWPQGVLRRR